MVHVMAVLWPTKLSKHVFFQNCTKYLNGVNDVLSESTSKMTYVTHFHDVSTNFCKQIHWCKNTVLGDGFAIELISLEVNQEYPLDYSEHIESTLINDIWIVSILNLTPNWQFNTRKSTVQLLDQTP